MSTSRVLPGHEFRRAGTNDGPHSTAPPTPPPPPTPAFSPPPSRPPPPAPTSQAGSSVHRHPPPPPAHHFTTASPRQPHASHSRLTFAPLTDRHPTPISPHRAVGEQQMSTFRTGE